MAIKLLRLLTGEEVLADIITNTSETDKLAGHWLTIKNPVRIGIVSDPNDPSQARVTFLPWAEFSTDRTFVIALGAVVCIMNPLEEFTTRYQSHFGGLVVPSGAGKLLRP